MDQQELAHILIILVGLLRAVGIASIVALIFLGARIRFIFLTAILTVGGIFTTVLSFLLGILSFTHAVVYELFAIGSIMGMLYYAYKDKKSAPPPKPSENTRCAFCSALIRENRDYFVLKCEDQYLFFDSEEHMKEFLKNIEEQRKFRKLDIGKPECYYSKTNGKWIQLKQEEVRVQETD
ncbi:hypothetical protein [Thermocrinis sp.]|uniref:hypothetical protein n=1 Tax=Thermocrinis sp. TaxID=2024383 RepID=UPI002FDCECB1